MFFMLFMVRSGRRVTLVPNSPTSTMYVNKRSNNFDSLRLIFEVTAAIVHAALLTQIKFVTKSSRYLSSDVAVD